MQGHRQLALFALLVLLAAMTGAVADDAKPPAPPKPTPNSPDEPMAEKLSLTNAATFLDGVSLAWTTERKCGACHTNYPYLIGRTALKEQPGGS